jgi:hypothetical protein
MITNDLLQTQLSMGAYGGAINPFNVPYTSLQTAINPTAFNPLAGLAQTGVGQAGVPNYGAIAQQQQQLQQLASILASQGVIPQVPGISSQNNPWQNQLVNPILAQQLALQAASAYAQPQYGQQFGSPFGQQYGSPFAQNPFAQPGYQLAPQSWVGQAGPFGGQQLPGQIHPHHLAGRGLY